MQVYDGYFLNFIRCFFRSVKDAFCKKEITYLIGKYGYYPYLAE